MVAIRCTDKPSGNPSPTPSKLLEQLQGKGYYSFFSSENWTPTVNLYETDLEYLVCVDLAGVDKEKIEIEVVNGSLRLRGNRNVPMWTEGPETPNVRVRMHLMEIDHGSFARRGIAAERSPRTDQRAVSGWNVVGRYCRRNIDEEH